MEAKPSTRHNCKEVMERIHSIIDGEMTRHDRQQLLAEIENCTHCTEHFVKSSKIKTLLHLKLERKSCGEALLVSIRNKISNQH
ncbi:MAG: zf-HC2 domain-containing protein [Chitinophagales bacterium]|nr:zf-HC2 domain-containing protein [Chitinophagales bacterium]